MKFNIAFQIRKESNYYTARITNLGEISSGIYKKILSEYSEVAINTGLSMQIYYREDILYY